MKVNTRRVGETDPALLKKSMVSLKVSVGCPTRLSSVTRTASVSPGRSKFLRASKVSSQRPSVVSEETIRSGSSPHPPRVSDSASTVVKSTVFIISPPARGDFPPRAPAC